MLSETGLRLFEHPLEVTDAGAFVFSWSVCPLGVGHLAGLTTTTTIVHRRDVPDPKERILADR